MEKIENLILFVLFKLDLVKQRVREEICKVQNISASFTMKEKFKDPTNLVADERDVIKS